MTWADGFSAPTRWAEINQLAKTDKPTKWPPYWYDWELL